MGTIERRYAPHEPEFLRQVAADRAARERERVQHGQSAELHGEALQFVARAAEVLQTRREPEFRRKRDEPVPAQRERDEVPQRADRPVH